MNEKASELREWMDELANDWTDDDFVWIPRRPRGEGAVISKRSTRQATTAKAATSANTQNKKGASASRL